MIRFGAFIEPRGVVRDLVVEWKDRVECVLPGQPYCCHPPHSTVVISTLRDTEEWVRCLADMLSRVPAFRMDVNSVVGFPNDVLAGGGYTLAYRADVTTELLQLQLACAEAMVNYVDHDESNRPPLAEVEPFKSSYDKYGFPFVGEHWIPHFSICSLQVPPDHELITEFMSQEPRFGFEVTEIGIWRVEADDHVTVAVAELG